MYRQEPKKEAMLAQRRQRVENPSTIPTTAAMNKSMLRRKHRQTKKVRSQSETHKQIPYTKVQTHLMILQKNKPYLEEM